MLTLRTLAIVVTGAGVFAGLPLTDARACDDDRYPCPVRLEALTQETADVPTQPAPSAQPQKCMSSEHFGQLAWQFKRMSGSSGLKVQAAIAC
jgi:hypothetical protein